MPLSSITGLVRLSLGALLVLLSLASSGWALASDSDPRLFVETGYRVGNDDFWQYFQRRGGVATFGFPISRQFTFLGSPVQFFQRGVLQQRPDGGVGLLNLLDAGLLPYTEINFSTYPAADPAIAAIAPPPGSPDYGSRMVEFLQLAAPDVFDGKQVRFYESFMKTVSFSDAFPDGNGSESLLPLLNLEIWGVPTSKPTYDPNNANFIYLRFQRGIMHYDQGCHCTQGILLADYLKSLLTGEGLPADLEAEAASSPYLRQYDPSRPLSLARPDQLPGTDLTSAFVKDIGTAIASSPQPAATPAPGPGYAYPAPLTSGSSAPASSAPPPAGVNSAPYTAASPEYGIGIFVWDRPDAAKTMSRVRDLGFGWQKSLISWRDVEGAGKGKFDWSGSDALVQASQVSGLKILARVDFEPAWARRDGANNGPPDNYQDYADFLRALVSRYKTGSSFGHVDAIEVWNEPNLAREWGNQPVNRQQARDYVRLLSIAYDAIKAADPTASVVSAGLSPTGWNDDTARPDDVYLQWLYDAGLRYHFDALGAHAPGYKAPPELSPAEAAANSTYGGDRSFTFRRVEDLRAIMERNGDGSKKIWVTEFGWTSDTVHPAYAWHAVTESQKADYLVRAFQWASAHWSPWIGVMTVWNMPDAHWGPQDEMYWWGISNPDGSPRPAYTALQTARRNGTLP